MEETKIDREAFINEMYSYASSLLKNGKDFDEVKTALLERGLDETDATYIINGFEREFETGNKTRAYKEMFVGVVCFFIGLTTFTANMPYLSWCVILLSLWPFCKGAARYMKR